MVEYVLDLTKSAKDDLREIREYSLKNFTEQQADKYMEKIHGALMTIQSSPESYRLREGLGRKYRSLSIGKHSIFYQIEGNRISVVGVIHGAMDLNKEFAKRQAQEKSSGRRIIDVEEITREREAAEKQAGAEKELEQGKGHGKGDDPIEL